MRVKNHIFYLLIGIYAIGCQKGYETGTNNSNTLFTLVPDSHSKVNFKNILKQDVKFNFLNYPYIYLGGGVAVGDINNDGLQDIYFSSNQNDNKLYLNEGGFQFKDITISAGVEDSEGWTTGVNFTDINNDGLLDIYVCKSGSFGKPQIRRNLVFINQGDNTFKEEGKKWGLDHFGFSIQSYFFDFDKDGDLDMYLVNHRSDFQNARIIDRPEKTRYLPEFSDQLFRNEGGRYINITQQSGIGNKAWGLSASIGDFNGDDWPDVYVANDYIQPDILYINNRDGTFTDQILNRFNHISYNSMGSDYADINNDMLPDLLVLDMLAEDHSRSKENMATMNTKGFWLMVGANYHYSYMSNMLHLNGGNGNYKDIGQLAGISKTDWSWAPLIADFDNDGHKDIFISNGIERDLSNQDYRRELNKILKVDARTTIDKLENMMPSNKLSNYVFKNMEDLSFEKRMEEWGLDKKINSNGVAYADFDNDGDLDLVMNNQSENATIYENHSTNNYISINLKGSKKNTKSIGAKVIVHTESIQYQENYHIRGYQSSMENTLNFGIGANELADSIQVIWNDSTITTLKDVKANQRITISKKDTEKLFSPPAKEPNYFKAVTSESLGINYTHQENNFDDFSIQALLPQKQSNLGPALAVGDINNDGLDDFYIGGAKNQSGSIYMQQKTGKFALTNSLILASDKEYEDQGALFFDLENDGDLDLYVTSGGYEFEENSPLYQDRIYLNNGKGKFVKGNVLPQIYTSTKKVTAIDFDGDKDLDLLIGGRIIPGKYPLSPNSYLLKNEKGKYIDITKEIAPELSHIGLVNDIVSTDYDTDGDMDFMVVGEWMPITLFENTNGKFQKKVDKAFEQTEGWWNTIKAVDLDQDGDDDYLVGNLGLNNKFHPTIEKPLHIFSNYFDDNDSYDMVLSKIYKGELVPVRGKECSTEQTPFISDKIPTFKDFASASMNDIYGKEKLESAFYRKAYTFNSIVIMNNKNSFALKNLPNASQVGPTLSFEILDINNDGKLDILGAGAIHETEVETIRYDSNTGYLLLGEKEGNFNYFKDMGLQLDGNVKHIEQIVIQGDNYLLIANNNGPLEFLKISNGKN